ncbi:MAG: DUF2892 domain-containing protein [Gammaproteobacteria bacterium]|nr:DUF2892 domain-containing protein [Gammaproteobacteria bacterium]
MRNPESLFDEVPNLGLLDRCLRLAAGSAAIIVVLASQDIGMLDGVALIPLLAVYPIMTGLVAFDPLYEWLGINTRISSVVSDVQVLKTIYSLCGVENRPVNTAGDKLERDSRSQRDAA